MNYLCISLSLQLCISNKSIFKRPINLVFIKHITISSLKKKLLNIHVRLNNQRKEKNSWSPSSILSKHADFMEVQRTVMVARGVVVKRSCRKRMCSGNKVPLGTNRTFWCFTSQQSDSDEQLSVSSDKIAEGVFWVMVAFEVMQQQQCNPDSVIKQCIETSHYNL